MKKIAIVLALLMALLPLSAEDRDGLMESHDVEGMSSRELQQLVLPLAGKQSHQNREYHNHGNLKHQLCAVAEKYREPPLQKRGELRQE